MSETYPDAEGIVVLRDQTPTTPRTDPERRIDGAREEAERRFGKGRGGWDPEVRDAFVDGATWADQQHEATTRALLSDLHDARTRAMEAEGEVARLTPKCDAGCRYGDGPMENCSQHGRPVAEVWQIVAKVQAQRDEEKAEVARLWAFRDEVEAAVTDWGAGTVHRPSQPAYRRILAALALLAGAGEQPDDPGAAAWLARANPSQSIDLGMVAAEIAAARTCPTCSPPIRETVGMVCQTCGTDYGRSADLHPDDSADLRERIYQAWHGTTEPWGGCADRERIDRVLAVVRPAVTAAQAWDEGYTLGRRDGAEFEQRIQMRDWWGPMPTTPNPYRHDARADGGAVMSEWDESLCKCLPVDVAAGVHVCQPTPTWRPENICEECGGPNPAWSVDNDIWNAVIGQASPINFLCPNCFIGKCEQTGVAHVWRLTTRNDRTGSEK